MKDKIVISPRQRIEQDLDALSTLLESFTRNSNFSFEQLLVALKEKHEKKTPALIPTIILCHEKLGIMQAVVKYLKEEFRFTYHEIALLLKRDDRVIWATYHNAQKKQKFPLLAAGTPSWIPLSIFAQPEKGPLESVVIYLHDHVSLSFNEIAKLLQRDNRVIWAVYHKRRKRR